MITGLITVRDVVHLGYPLVEAIVAALPVVDEMVVGDGGSTDGTARAIERLRARHPDKIRVYPIRWAPSEGQHTLVTAAAQLMPFCRQPYVLYLQANEIVHEASVAALRDLPRRYPDADLFRFPFYNLLGPRLVWHVDYRRRLFRRLPWIGVNADGYDVGVLAREAARLAPRRLWGWVRRREGEVFAWLPEPVYRYRGLSPVEFLGKLAVRKSAFGEPPSIGFAAELEHARAVLAACESDGQRDPVVFWRRMQPFFDDLMWKIPGLGPRSVVPRTCEGEITGAPAIMAANLQRWRYDVEAALSAAGC